MDGNSAPPVAAVVKIAAAHFVCRPMPRKQIGKLIGKIPALKKERRIAIVMLEYPVSVMVRAENIMAHRYRSSKVQRSLTKHSQSAVKKLPAATEEFLMAVNP